MPWFQWTAVLFAATAAHATTVYDSETVAMLEWAVPVNQSAADLYRELTLQLIAPTQQEPGCLHFDIYEDVAPNTMEPRIWQYLVFRNKAAHEAHMASPVVTTWSAAIQGLLKDEKLQELTLDSSMELPLQCANEVASVVVLVKMYTEDVADYPLVAKASVDLINSTRSEPGCAYYDQLVPPVATNEISFVQEVLWFVDEDAHQKHMSSAPVQHFLKVTAAAQVQFDVSVVQKYTSLPSCPSEATLYTLI
eukprot:CAMPEP_0194477292 /NCGR_PEP_ID=MMETSP0253-20130528/1066_1 /TAXON_ID=2966 /ORGANISM="Noctiluca scintillans" /LENGTH=249 /DNA_ID=CAMNT_0039316251 /DNA_START=45 /DNA_END=794 /DNA_ORIENTATION=+